MNVPLGNTDISDFVEFCEFPDVRDISFDGRSKNVFDLKLRNFPVGFAELYFLRNPFNFCYMDYLFVEPDYRGRGFGRLLLDRLNGFLIDSGISGVLLDGIKNESKGMYQRRGWTPFVREKRFLGFNMPNDFNEFNVVNSVYSI